MLGNIENEVAQISDQDRKKKRIQVLLISKDLFKTVTTLHICFLAFITLVDKPTKEMRMLVVIL